uniref:Uncharacterized protein n=1 Tax=Catagonus wagneri TaxID=51154 RepID=A0A8C3WPE6_9CETA
MAINGVDTNGKEVLEYLGNPANYPVSIRFGQPRLTSNEKLMLSSMFHSLFAAGGRPRNAVINIPLISKNTKIK